MRYQYGSKQQPLVAQFKVACVGQIDGKIRSWTPYLRKITINGKTQNVPSEYGEDGVEAADCSSETAEAAADAICLKYIAID